MPILDYTTYSEIRATLGVSATELPDTVLSQEQWALFLNLALSDVHSDLASTYATISALPSNSRSTSQQRLYELVRLFASYTTANTLLTSLTMFGVERLTDGRAEFQRVADPYSDTREGVVATLETIRKRLVAAYNALVPGAITETSATFTMTAAIGLAVDPVTNA
jgi:hypothetical protein